MTTKELLDRISGFIQELTAFYGELTQELPNLRVVVDNTRVFSELKKMAQRYYNSLARRRIRKKIYHNNQRETGHLNLFYLQGENKCHKNTELFLPSNGLKTIQD